MAKGSALLKIGSFLMVIGACLGLLGFIIILISLTALGAGFFTTIAFVFIFVGFAAGAVQLVAGIVGLKNWNRPQNARLCIVLGIISAIFWVANIVYSATSAGDSISTILLTFVAGVLVPALYIVGAVQLAKQH